MAMTRRDIGYGTTPAGADGPSRPPALSDPCGADAGAPEAGRGACPLGGHVRLMVAALLVAAGLVTGGSTAGAAVGHHVVAGFGYDQSWRVDRHPRFVADITGDGRADVVGFGDDGVWVAVANADRTFAAPRHVVAGFGYDQSWRVDRHPRFVTDITGDRRADLVAIGDDGVYTAVAQGDGTFAPPRHVLNAFGATTPLPLALVQSADVDGDGAADLIGIRGNEVWVALARRDSPGLFIDVRLSSTTYPAIYVERLIAADVTGDRRADLLVVRTYVNGVTGAVSQGAAGYTEFRPVGAEFIGSFLGGNLAFMDAVVDVDGDGSADIVGFGYSDTGTYLTIAESGARFPEAFRASDHFGHRENFQLRLAGDITGDTCADLVGFGDAGVFTAVSSCVGPFVRFAHVVDGFGGSWAVDRHPRFVADVTADGCGDVVGFGDDGVYVAFSRCDGTFE